MNAGLIVFVILSSICAATFLVFMGVALSRVAEQSETNKCTVHHDCGYFEMCCEGKCYLGCTNVKCKTNQICVNEFHSWRCECVPGYVPTANDSCRNNVIEPIL